MRSRVFQCFGILVAVIFLTEGCASVSSQREVDASPEESIPDGAADDGVRGDASDALESDPLGFVTDMAAVITSAEEDQIEAEALSIKRKTGVDVLCLTIGSLESFESIEAFAMELEDAWSVQSETILLIVVMEEREVRLQVGFGLQGAIPDGRAGAILDEYMIPLLRAERYGEGMREGVTALRSILMVEYGQDGGK